MRTVCVPGCIELYIFISTEPPAGIEPKGKMVDVVVDDVDDVLDVEVLLLVDDVLVLVVGGWTT